MAWKRLSYEQVPRTCILPILQYLRTCLGAAATHDYVIGTEDSGWPGLACAACHPRLKCFCCRPLYPAGTSRALAIPSFPQILACVQALASRSIDKKFSLRCDLMQLLTLGS